MKNPKWLLFCLSFVILLPLFSQTQPSSVLYHKLLRFKDTKRVLFVAAHPDDENTRLIAYLANAEHAEVAYLSLTRGDGGQNLLGKELGIELGLIRTNELLRARETDGGRQYFTRALDFGYSKNPIETFNNWDKEKLLADVVWMVRKFQPDIIINRFNTIPGTTHGHHTSSALLSVETFNKAADPKVFPEQLKYTQPWQAKRIFWNAYNWGGQYEPEEGKTYYTFSVGDYNPLLGTTYSQIAADSRTMHKSQGFGSTSQIGQGNDFIELVSGNTFKNNPFEDISNRWKQLTNGDSIIKSIDAALSEFDFISPEKNSNKLLAIKSLLDKERTEELWFLEKKIFLDALILEVLGVKAEFTVKKELGFPGEKIKADLVFNNPSAISLKVESFEGKLFQFNIGSEARNNVPVSQSFEISIPRDYPVSQPFWLKDPLDGSLFNIQDLQLIGKPVNNPSIEGTLSLLISGELVKMNLPLKFKYNDQVDGEIKQPFTLVPEVNVKLDKNNLFLVEGADKILKVDVTFNNKILEGELVIDGLIPGQYRILSVDREERRNRLIYTVEFLGSDEELKDVLVSFKTKDGLKFNQDTKRIIYKHIPNLTYFTSTTLRLIQMDLKLSKQRIGYINGAGDDVPDVLRNLGYEVNFLEDSDFKKERLMSYQTLIVGIRAFNVNQALADNIDQLMAYVKEGGNLIVQYNTSSPLLTRELGPYPFSISRFRVAVENSPVKADYSHPLMSIPNKILPSDFEGWVQERGLYFTSEMDKNYSTPLTMNDPGEQPNQGSMIFTTFGKGTYTYTGLSWFRQLPAGVPGAIKIFVNLIEQAGEGSD